MQKLISKSDSKLEIGGVRVDRTQFNMVYDDVINCLNQVRRETGRKIEVANLGLDVWIPPHEKAVGGAPHTNIYQGFYLKDTPVRLIVELFTTLITDKHNHQVVVKCLRGIWNGSELAKTVGYQYASFLHPMTRSASSAC